MLFLALAALAAFGATLGLGFIWDDHQFIEANPYIRSWTLANLKHAFLSDPFNQSLNYYRPFQTLSNMLDFSVWKLNPFGYHLANLFFHAAGAVLVFVLASELGLAQTAAFLAALFFAVNPTGIEQMIIVAGRAELASSAFTLASVLLFLRRKPAPSFLAFMAALGFKENGIVTPLLIAFALWFLRRGRREYFKLVFFLLPVPLYLWLRHSATGAAVIASGPADFVFQAAEKFPPAAVVYIRNAFLPLNMHSHRMQPDLAPWFYSAYAAWAVFLVVLAKYRPRAAIFAFGWYLLNLAPKFPLLAGGDLMLEHWSYLANAALYAAAGAALSRLMGSGGWKRTAAGLGAGGLVLFWIIAANANLRLRSDDLKLYEHAARYSSSKPMLYNLSREYYLAGRFRESREILLRITAADPGNAMYLNGLALTLRAAGDKTGAAAAVNRLLAGHPGDAGGLLTKASLVMEEGKPAEAERLLNAAVKAGAGGTAAYSALAGFYLERGREADALAAYESLLRLDPRDQTALTNSGIIHAKNGRYAEAEKSFLRALELDPASKPAALNLEKLRALKR